MRGGVGLLLADVVMPGKSGPELYGMLRTKRPSLEVVYITGYTDAGIFIDEVSDGHITYMQKPFEPADLARKVREVLDE